MSSPYIVGSIPKLPAKYAAIIMPLLLSCLMSGIVSLVNTLKNIGWIDGAASIWFHSWMLSWLIAFPAILIALPVVKRVVALVVNLPSTSSH